MADKIRTTLIFAAPLLVGVLNTFHPVRAADETIYETIHGVVAWWIVLHILNLFGFGLLGLAAYLFILDRHGPAATLAKAALLVFVPAYVGFDAVIGIGTGNLVRYANDLLPAQLAAFQPAIDAFWNSRASTGLAIAGSTAWTIAMGASAVSVAREQRMIAILLAVAASPFTGWGYASSAYGTWPWWLGVAVIGATAVIFVRPGLPVGLLLLSGILFGTTHVVPFGPLGAACFAAAALIQRSSLQQAGMRDLSAART